MKKLIVLLAIVAIVGVSGLVFAGEPVIKHIGDALVGNNDFLNTSAYIAYTTKDTLSIKGIPVVPKGIRVKLGTPIGNGSFRTGTLEVGWEL